MLPSPLLKVNPSARDAWQTLKEEWEDCTRCPLCESRKRVVHVRGFLPAHVAFIGEAPGKSEDRLGYPFVGEAGHLLQEILDRVQEETQPFRYAILNVVAYRVVDMQSGLRIPFEEEARECASRLLKIINPMYVFTLGKVSESFLPFRYFTKGVIVKHLPHPAYLLRLQGPKQELAIKRMILTIKETIR